MGIVGHSAAMLAGMLSIVGLCDRSLSLFVRISSKPEDEGYDYDMVNMRHWQQPLSVLLYYFLSVWDFVERRFIHLSFSAWRFFAGTGMLALIAALVSIVLAGSAFTAIWCSREEVEFQAVVANAWHHRSDALSSIGTAVGIGGAILWEIIGGCLIR